MRHLIPATVAFLITTLFTETDRLIAAPPSAIEKSDVNVIESFNVAGTGACIVIPVTINQKVYKFMVDTGSGFHIFDSSLKPLLQQTDARAEHQNTIYMLYQLKSGVVGQSQLPVKGMGVCQDLSQIRSYSGEEIYGIIGMAFLRDHLIQLDFDGGQLRFLNEKAKRPGERLPMTLDRYGSPTIQVSLPGIIGATPFVIDTGSSICGNGNLSPKVIDILVGARTFKLDRMTTREVTLVAGKVKPRQGTITNVSVGRFQHDNQTFNEGPNNALGLGYLSRYKVTFDFPAGALYLAKGKKFDRTFNLDHMGWKLLVRNNVVEVEEVDPDGQAVRAGIRKGEQVIEIDGQKTIEMSVYDIESRIGGSPNGLRLTIRDPNTSALRLIEVVDDVVQ